MSKRAAPVSPHGHTLFVAEPSAQFLVRPALVLDCSVLSAMLFDEPQREAATQHLLGRTLHAPILLEYELASVALKKLGLGWPVASIDLAFESYQQQDIALHATKLREQCALAQQYGLSAYDAAYLWLAAELKAPLATFDARLAKAAKLLMSGLQ